MKSKLKPELTELDSGGHGIGTRWLDPRAYGLNLCPGCGGGKPSGASSALRHLQNGGAPKCGFKSSPLKAHSVLLQPCRKAKMRMADNARCW